MNPQPEWVVTVRMTGRSTETYHADRCATAPHAALSLQTRNIGCCLVKGRRDTNEARKWERAAQSDAMTQAGGVTVTRPRAMDGSQV